MSIEELLDSEKEARIVEKILEHPQEVSLEETAKFAPILKPSLGQKKWWMTAVRN